MSSVKIGNEIKFKSLVSNKKITGKVEKSVNLDGTDCWAVTTENQGEFLVRKSDHSIEVLQLERGQMKESYKEKQIDKLVRFMLRESATATPATKYTYKNFYVVSDGLKNKIDAVRRPARMPKPAGWQGVSLPSGLKPIDYGHCEGIFVDKYGKLRGEKMYEDLFVNGNNNAGWTVAKGILQEKVAMLKALEIDISVSKYDSLSYWLIYKAYLKTKFPQIAQKLGFK